MSRYVFIKFILTSANIRFWDLSTAALFDVTWVPERDEAGKAKFICRERGPCLQPAANAPNCRFNSKTLARSSSSRSWCASLQGSCVFVELNENKHNTNEINFVDLKFVLFCRSQDLIIIYWLLGFVQHDSN